MQEAEVGADGTGCAVAGDRGCGGTDGAPDVLDFCPRKTDEAQDVEPCRRPGCPGYTRDTRMAAVPAPPKHKTNTRMCTFYILQFQKMQTLEPSTF